MLHYSVFAKADGTYNPHYLAHLQILGAPSDTGVIEPAILKHSTLGRLVDKFQSALGNRQPALFTKMLRALQENNDKLWTAHKMSGAEYERGGFLAYAASRLSTLPMTAHTISLDVGFDVLPSADAQRYADKDSILTLRQSMLNNATTLPERATVDVHIIAPKAKMQTTIDMLRQAAEASEEQVTHRGFGFNRAVAHMVSGTQSPDKTITATGWFEIHQGVFIFIDRSQFKKLADALDIPVPATPAPRAPAPKTQP